MILSCQNISKSFGAEDILKNVSFHIEAGEKAAIVGINGAGKTTLLRVIMHEVSPDSGEVILAKGATIGYLPQNPDVAGNRTIYEEVLSAKEYVISLEKRLRGMEDQMDAVPEGELGDFMDSYHKLQDEFERLDGYTYQSEVIGVLRGLGFPDEDFGKRMQELSGGQRTRVCLGKLLVTKLDVILLDEPTNHLDIGAITWLEGYLSNYRGAVVVVAHDRYFLDKVAGKVIELDCGKSSVYEGNYSAYARSRAQVRETLLRQYYNQQREIKHQEEVITKLRSFNREKSIKRAESREKMLDKVERLEKPTEENTDIKIRLEPRIVSGNDVLRVEHLSKAFPGQQLFSDVSFEIHRGERVALIGDNGTGKTTILKIINGLLDADSGSVTLGTNVHIGYYDQEQQVLSMEKTLVEEISDDYPYLTNTEIRNVLAAFLFTGDEVFKQIKDLSGGERGRVSLAKLMLSEANLLILDEPTNHLDITSKEILEQALCEYAGTVFFVSHDRYFINKACTRILNLTGETLVEYLGDYDYYLEKSQAMQGIVGTQAGKASQGGNSMQSQGILGAQAGKSVRGGKPIRSQDAMGTRNSNPMQSQGTVGTQAGKASQSTVGTQGGIAHGKESDGKLEWMQRKEEQARKRKQENDLKKTEARIEEAETRVSELEAEFMKPDVATNSARLGELQAEYDALRKELEGLYEVWEGLAAEVGQ